jgi:myo-inositol-1(or 4)-monophosphatase
MPEIIALRYELEELARRLGRHARQARPRPGAWEVKPDGSIVTAADVEVERQARSALAEMLPGSHVWGEELGHEHAGVDGLWLVDPIDGTSNYAFGSPMWGVSIALAIDSRLLVGVVHLPDLGETYSAARGYGATLNGIPIAPIPEGPVRDEELVSCGDSLLCGSNPRWPGKKRYSGAFVVDAMFVASQRLRGMVGHKAKLYDVAASLVVCTEVGADIRYADGRPLEIEPLMADVVIPEPFLIFPPRSGFTTR